MDLIANTHWNRDKSDEWSWVGENVTAYTVTGLSRRYKMLFKVIASW